MIGRAAASNPWIFRQISQYTATGRYDVASRSDRYEMIRRYFRMLIAEGYPDAAGKMKQFASWFTHGVEGGAKLRKAIYEAKSAAEIVEAVDLFFAQHVVVQNVVVQDKVAQDNAGAAGEECSAAEIGIKKGVSEVRE
jgi:tRNA-dihydrouridine synthase